MTVTLTLTLLLLLAAFVCTVMSAMGKLPLWISSLLLVLAVATAFFPGRI